VIDQRPVALVTGAARGIGAATTAHLVNDGWRVIALDRCADDPALNYRLGTQADLDSVVRNGDGMVLGAVADVGDRDAFAVAIERPLATFGRLDAAVAAAGVIIGGRPIWEHDTAALAAQQRTNLDGVVHTAQLTIPHLLRSDKPRSGRFVAVASSAALTGLAGLAAYGATKAAVVGLVRSMAKDLADSGVTANAVCPGSTDTPILAESARLYGLDDVTTFARHAPQDRLLAPSEVAATIAFLCSPAAGAINGAAVPVDGGMTA